MIRLAIIEKDAFIIKKLEKYFENNKNIKICFFTNDGEVGLIHIIENNSKIDLLLLDLIIKNKDGITIMSELKERNINLPMIVCSSCNSDKMISQASSFNICAYLLKPYDLKELENKIKNTVNNEFCYKQLDERIMILLHSIGISSKYKGYKYLKDSIRMFYFYPEYLITKEIYSALAIKYKVSKSCIERAISRAIEVGFNRIDCNYIEKIFGSSISLERGTPTNVELIVTIVERLNIIKQSML